jgi:cytochrome c5
MSTPGEHDQHSSFIKTPQQLLVVVAAAFLVPIFGIVLLVQLVLSTPSADPNALSAESVAARIAPVGRVEFGAASGAVAAASSAPTAKPGRADGKKVYDGACMACHASGVANAPKLGDKAAWAPRMGAGASGLMQSVIKGKGAMPPKAGNPALTDAEIRAAVDFMVSQAK